MPQQEVTIVELRRFVNDYHQLKSEMERSGEEFGLTDRRTVEISQKLDVLVNQIMRIKNPGANKQGRSA